MSRPTTAWIDGDSPESPPSANGELLFEAPWEARAFGMAHSLCDAGCFTWDEFRRELIEAIARWQASAAADAEYHYYERWLEALARVLENRGVTEPEDIARRAAELAARPHGFDHSHD